MQCVGAMKKDSNFRKVMETQKFSFVKKDNKRFDWLKSTELTINKRKFLLNRLVQSLFDYCGLVWGNCGKTLSNNLQKLQNRAARVITSSNFDVDVDSLFHKLSWRDLKSQRQIRNAWMVFKSLNGLVPEYLKSKFIKRNESNYSLRDSVNKLVVPFPRTNYLKNSFIYSGATLWNSLPCNIRESGSLNQFKRLLYHNF